MMMIWKLYRCARKNKKKYPNEKIIFCNGGDRNQNNIPEMIVDGIDFEFGIGRRDKKNSSSSSLKIGNMRVKIEYGDFL